MSGPPAKIDITTGIIIKHGEEPSEPSVSTTTLADSDFFYFSYDDSSSTASLDLSTFYIQSGLKPSPKWGRAYEYLNAESFDHFEPQALGPFEVSMALYVPDKNEFPFRMNGDYEGDILYSLGVNISGPSMSKANRPNIVATFLVDISGSMESNYAPETISNIRSLLDVAKHGLITMLDSLKPGDVVNILTFGAEAKNLVLKWQYNVENIGELVVAINNIKSQGSTNLVAGIKKAYTAAEDSFDPRKSNRVIILTDAFANVGEINPEIIARNTVVDGAEGIYFAGVGIGSGFNEAFLNELTDIGKGSYTAMVTPEDSERIFGKGFTGFIDAAATDVGFRLDYPNTFIHLVEESSAEQVSTDQEKVQTINFAYNTQQFFLENFSTSDIDTTKKLSFEISFTNKLGEKVSHRLEKSIDDLLRVGEEQIKSAAMVAALSGLVSNKLTCAEVMSSPLYGENIGTTIYIKYYALISDLCLL